jgi:uncharacterized lipoprotein YajG
MKKVFVLLAVLVMFAGCSAPPSLDGQYAKDASKGSENLTDVQVKAAGDTEKASSSVEVK